MRTSPTAEKREVRQMIVPSGAVDKAMGIHLQKIYKTNAPGSADQIGSKDVVTISKFAALVEQGRQSALSLPEVRADRVERVDVPGLGQPDGDVGRVPVGGDHGGVAGVVE